MRANDKEKVREHYDRMSPYCHSLWGEHIHHGYWIRGDESKETAQVQQRLEIRNQTFEIRDPRLDIRDGEYALRCER